MILRLFRARPRPGQEGAYEEFLLRTTIPLVRRQPGCLEVRMGKTYRPEAAPEFVIVSVWDSLEHLKAATGGRWDEPVVDPEEALFLESTECEHFEENGSR